MPKNIQNIFKKILAFTVSFTMRYINISVVFLRGWIKILMFNLHDVKLLANVHETYIKNAFKVFLHNCFILQITSYFFKWNMENFWLFNSKFSNKNCILKIILSVTFCPIWVFLIVFQFYFCCDFSVQD